MIIYRPVISSTLLASYVYFYWCLRFQDYTNKTDTMLRKRPPSQRQHPASLRTILPTQNNNQHNIVQARRKLKPRSSLLKRFQRNTIILSSAVVASVCLYKVSTSITSLAASAKFLSSHKNHKPVTIGCYFDGTVARGATWDDGGS